MQSQQLRITACLTLAAGLLLSPLAMSHFDDKEVMQSYRQSWFAMVAANFGPMVATVKGEIPWDEERMQAYAKQLSTLSNMDISRGFSPGTEKGTTRAKPEIWSNMEDFNNKLAAMREEVGKLQAAVSGGDRREVLQGIAATGESCKSCHDEYKSKDYIY
jgi:cytochrome c556